MKIAAKTKASEYIARRQHARLKTYLNSCVRCGLCAESCHYYLAKGDARFAPARKVEIVSQVYRRYHTLLGRFMPGWVGAVDIDDEALDSMLDSLFGACSMCGRCSLHCSIGIDIPYLVRTGRAMLAELGLVPSGIQSTLELALQTGNNMGITHEDLVDTLQWLEEDLQMEVNDNKARIPLDSPNAQILYTINPREAKFFPLSISAVAKIFHAAGEDWTISTRAYDATNYGYFTGDDKAAGELVNRLFEETIRLNSKTLVLAECGHGFRAMRWEGAGWIQRSFPFEVKSVIEIIADYIRTGRIALEKNKNQKAVTLHDPCNLVRNGGIIKAQRFVLQQAVENFREMVPNRENNYCCGGGGGQLAMGEYKQRRIEAGRIKAEQIRRTGAQIVATPCHNCIDQLMELNNDYRLNVEVKTVAELVADALIIN
ncbi:(Fe-S)-binding protein [candidate division KSB1 bacterium]|nr:(Fe-S)-binding protein [candidate division KSB1 bacterium]